LAILLSCNCIIDRGKGEVAYYGETQFAEGFWVGIILNEPKGLNNGTVKGVEYFKCENKHGIFFRPSQVSVSTDVPSSSLEEEKDADEVCPNSEGVKGIVKKMEVY
uniref:CAP-Gly domain-containing protein n=1 Tax=Syphacia muris TaxID=451379 RepID=A0A0N5AAZ1_9BILA